jgi:putative FmdB family regulatory protein
MAVLHDYRCLKCQRTFEAFVNAEDDVLQCPLCGEGMAQRVFLRMGGMLGPNKGRYPYFDKQLGITLESSQHRDRVAKERGLVVMGRQEFDRSRNAPRSPDPLDDPNPDPKLIEIAKKVWDDHKYGRVKPEPPKPPASDNDFLDITNAPKIA